MRFISFKNSKLNSDFDNSVLNFLYISFLFLALTVIPVSFAIKSQLIRDRIVGGEACPYELTDETEVSQEFFIYGTLNKLSFGVANGGNRENSGILKVSLKQNDAHVVHEYDISLFGDWVQVDLPLTSQEFKYGKAELTFTAKNCNLGSSIFLIFSKGIDNGYFPAVLNGNEASGSIFFNYSELIVDDIVICSFIFLTLMIISVFFCAYTLTKKGYKDFQLYISLLIVIILGYFIKYPITSYKAEFLVEAGNDYFVTATNKSLLKNLVKLEGSGYYFSLWNRLITLLFVKFFKFIHFAPFAMYMTNILFFSCTAAFLSTKYFSHVLTATKRCAIIITIFFVIMSQDICHFINNTYLGILLITEIYLLDLTKLKKWQYYLCITLSFILILSKFHYVAVLPIAIINLVFFGKKKNTRWRIFNVVLIVSAVIQLIGTYLLTHGDLQNREFLGIHDFSISSTIKSVVYIFIQLYRSSLCFTLPSEKWTNIITFLALTFIAGFVAIKCLKKHEYGKYWFLICINILVVEILTINKVANASDALVATKWRHTTDLISNRHLVWCYSYVFLTLFILFERLVQYIKITKIIDKHNITAIFCLFSLLGYNRIYWQSWGIFYDKTEVGTSWKDYYMFAKKDAYAICTYWRWYITKNSKVREVAIKNSYGNGKERISDYVDLTDYKDKEILSITVYRANMNIPDDYQIILYDEEGNIIGIPQSQNASSLKRLISFMFDEPVKGVDHCEFITTSGKPAYIVNFCDVGYKTEDTQ